MMALLGLIAIQTVWSAHTYIAQPLLPGLYVGFAVLIATVTHWLRTQLGKETVISVLAAFLLFGGVLQALIGFAQHIDNPGWLASWIAAKQGPLIRGNVGQSNHFATYITLAAVALCYLFANHRISTWLTAGLITLLTFMVTLSGSRSVLLYLIGLLLLSYRIYRHRTPGYRRLITVSGALLVAFITAQFVAKPLSNGFLNQSFLDQEIVTASDRMNSPDSVMQRLSEWKKALVMFKEAPWLGIGAGNYGWHSFLLQTTPEFSGISKHQLFHQSHNIFTQTLAEFGAVGFVILLTLFLSWLRPFVARKMDLEWFFTGGVLLVLFIHSNLEFPLSYSYFLMIFVILIAVEEERAFRVTFTPGLGRLASATALAIIALILAITWYGFRQLTHLNNLIYTTTPEWAAWELHRISKNPLLQPWAESAMVKHGRSQKTDIQQLALMTRQMHYQPTSLNVYQQTAYLASAGRLTEAVALLKQAVIVYPNDLQRFLAWLEKNTDANTNLLLIEARRLYSESSFSDQVGIINRANGGRSN